jgi:hypothetical protein
MFRLALQAQARLSPEACSVAELFLAAMPPYLGSRIQSVRLFGPQARRFEPDAPFDILIVAEQRSPELRMAVSIGTASVGAEGIYSANVTVTTPFEMNQPSPAVARLLQNAKREGVDLWTRSAS